MKSFLDFRQLSSVVSNDTCQLLLILLEIQLTMIKQAALSLFVSIGMSSAFTSVSTRGLRRSSSLLSSSNGIDFSKYEGLGNDFILIDDRDKESPSLTPDESERLCHRNFSVGADGVIFALKPPSDDYDFTMRIYNSDGSEPEMCGNGIRCFAQFLKDLGADGKSISSYLSFR